MDGNVDSDADNEAVEALVGNEQVAASAEDEDFEAVEASVADGFEKLGFAGDLAKEAGGAADAEGCEGSEGNLLLNTNCRRGHGLEGTTPGRLARRGDETVQS